ncbi:MAG: hypothetical protein Q9226_006914 [Calogaya cf. arnoldii]
MAPRLTKTFSAPTLIATFHIFPKELFRIATSLPFRIRARRTKPAPGTVYDLITKYGMVKPKALSPKNYEYFEAKINKFMATEAKFMTKEQWLAEYPRSSAQGFETEFASQKPSEAGEEMTPGISAPRINKVTNRERVIHNPTQEFEAEAISRKLSVEGEEMKLTLDTPRPRKVDSRQRVIHNLGKFQVVKKGSAPART